MAVYQAVHGSGRNAQDRSVAIRDMLIQLTRQMRIRAAITLAVVYAFCLIFAPVSFAFGTLAAPCLGMTVVQHPALSSDPGRDHHNTGQHQSRHQLGDQRHRVSHGPAEHAPHDHAAMQHHLGSIDHGSLDHGALGASQHHDDGTVAPDHNPQTKHVGACCGLFCSMAVAAHMQSVDCEDNFASAVLPACEENLAGRGPSRIDRPPSTTLMSS
jgi:hypothetical protein